MSSIDMSSVNSSVERTSLNESYSLSWQVPMPAKISMYIVYSVIFVLGTAGNAVVVGFIYFRRASSQPGQRFIAALACTDFLSSLVMPFVMLNDLANDFQWHFGSFLCVLIPNMNPVLLFASAWCLVAISFERSRAILHPFRGPLKRKVMNITISSIYATALIVVSPNAYYHVVRDNQCWAMWPTSKDHFVFYLVFSIVTSFIPLCLISISYFTMMQDLSHQTRVRSTDVLSMDRARQDAQVSRMFLIIIGTFFFLTTPYTIFLVVFTYFTAFDHQYYHAHSNLLMSLNYAIFTMSAINSCVNPLIYATNSFCWLKQLRSRISLPVITRGESGFELRKLSRFSASEKMTFI